MADEKKQKCFVIMPFTVRKEDLERYHGDPDHWNQVYDGLIVPAVENAELMWERDDEDSTSRMITESIWRKIEDADIILCDLSACNPNVFMELGWTIRADKKFVLMKDDLTAFQFDLNQRFTCEYSHMLQPKQLKEDVKKLEGALRATIKDDKKRYSMVYKLSLELGAIEAMKSGDVETRMLGEILEEIRDLKRDAIPKPPIVPTQLSRPPLNVWLPGTVWRKSMSDERIQFMADGTFVHESQSGRTVLRDWFLDGRSPKEVFLKWGQDENAAIYGLDEHRTLLAEAVPGGAVWNLERVTLI